MGLVFDIKEFTINDGPGIRLTVFLKGCPLRCKWCHNPEGLSGEPQHNVITGRKIGTEWKAEKLVAHCFEFKDCFDISGGGVTFSGGEATMQSEFLIACAEGLRQKGVHVLLDTCGHCGTGVFRRVLENVDMVYYDLKCMDPELHKEMTGVSNDLILENARVLAASAVPYHIRVPMVPGVSDTRANIEATKRFVSRLERPPSSVDWLPFNKLAGGKYPTYGMVYEFTSSENVKC